jgi:hypothetical protein
MRIQSSCAVVGFALVTAARLGGQSQIPLGNLLVQFNSPDPVQRANAFYALRATPGALANLGRSGTLLRALERENRLIYSTLDESNGTMGVSDKYGEGFGEYTSAIWSACVTYCDKHDPSLVRVFANGPLFPNHFMDQLATDHGREMLPIILKLAQPGKYDRQIGALKMLGSIGRLSRDLSPTDRTKLDTSLIAATESPSMNVPGIAVQVIGDVISAGSPLTSAQRTAYHLAILRCASNQYAPIRQTAVRALVVNADPSDLPLLQKLASGDTARNVNHGMISYPVREEARRAIAKMRPPR